MMKRGNYFVAMWTVMALGPAARGQQDGVAADAQYELLAAQQKVFQSVAAKMKPYLVRIETVGGTQPTGGSGGQSQGAFQDRPGSSFAVSDGPTTGIVYSSDGYILTSSFNFVRDPILISVTLPDGQRLAADIVARDHVRKLALLKVDASNLALPQWVSREDVRVGQWAISLGFGYGGEEPSISVGIISAMHRMGDNAIQTDAKLGPANYGGPLCDTHGRVMGICVPMAQRPGELAGVELYDAGVGFAMPKSRVDEIVTELMKGNSYYRGWLGISIDRRFRKTVAIGNVANPSPVYEAGIRAGDWIYSIEGRVVRHFGELVQALYMIPAGQEVDLCIERDEELISVTLRLARSEDLGPLPEVPEPFDPSDPFGQIERSHEDDAP